MITYHYLMLANRYYSLDSYALYNAAKAYTVEGNMPAQQQLLTQNNPYFFPHNKLSQAQIYKMWFEIAQMYQKGIDIPQNNVMAFIW